MCTALQSGRRYGQGSHREEVNVQSYCTVILSFPMPARVVFPPPEKKPLMQTRRPCRTNSQITSLHINVAPVIDAFVSGFDFVIDSRDEALPGRGHDPLELRTTIIIRPILRLSCRRQLHTQQVARGLRSECLRALRKILKTSQELSEVTVCGSEPSGRPRGEMSVWYLSIYLWYSNTYECIVSSG